MIDTIKNDIQSALGERGPKFQGAWIVCEEAEAGDFVLGRDAGGPTRDNYEFGVGFNCYVTMAPGSMGQIG